MEHPVNKPLALIIDDEPDILELLDLTLGRMNVQTRTATTVAEALDLLARQQFDLCLTDMRLPRSEEHTSELQSRPHLVCRLLLEKKKPQQCEARRFQIHRHRHRRRTC